MIALENTDPTDANGTVISFRGPTTGVGATTFVEYSAIQARVDIHDHATRTSSLGFYTSSSGTATERLRIDNSGNVGIGTTGSIYKLDVQGGDINTNGNVRAVSVVQTSDKRWKKNISPQKITLKN